MPNRDMNNYCEKLGGNCKYMHGGECITSVCDRVKMETVWQCDLFGNIKTVEIKSVTKHKLKCKTMQNLYGEKQGFICGLCKHKNGIRCDLWQKDDHAIGSYDTACNKWEAK